MKKRSLIIFVALALVPLILLAQISSPGSYSSVIMIFLRSTTAAAARSAIGAVNSGSGGELTNAVIYGSTSGKWTFGSTGTLTADTARTVTTTSGSLTLSSGSSHVVLSPSSSVGVGTTGPDAKLDVLSTAGSQYRATYTDGSVYSDWGTLSTGATLWTNSLGHRTTSTTVNDTSVLARQVQGGLAFDGVTTSSGVVSTLNASSVTSDTTVSVRFLVPESNPSVNGGLFCLTPSATTYSSISSYFGYIGTDGRLYIQRNSAVSVGQNIYDYVANFITLYGGKVVEITVVNNVTTPSLIVYINGVATATTSVSNGASVPTWAIPFTPTYCFIGKMSASDLFNKPIFSATLFNRALSASDVITLANQGVQEADKWGLLTGQTSGTLTRGKRYRITTFVAGDSFTNVGAASNATGVEFVATGTTPTTWTNSSTLNQIGSILDADLSAGVGYQVPDRSSNKYHGVVSATGTSWTQSNRRGQIRYTTTGATTGAFQLLSGTAIPANALIQSIVAWSAGTPLIYVGNATGTSNIVGHTTLAASTYTKLTQALDFSTTGNLWLNKSATNEVNLTVNYMINDP